MATTTIPGTTGTNIPGSKGGNLPFLPSNPSDVPGSKGGNLPFLPGAGGTGGTGGTKPSPGVVTNTGGINPPKGGTYNPSTGVYISPTGEGYSFPTAPSGAVLTGGLGYLVGQGGVGGAVGAATTQMQQGAAQQLLVQAGGGVKSGTTTYYGTSYIPQVGMTASEYERFIRNKYTQEGTLTPKQAELSSFRITVGREKTPEGDILIRDKEGKVVGIETSRLGGGLKTYTVSGYNAEVERLNLAAKGLTQQGKSLFTAAETPTTKMINQILQNNANINAQYLKSTPYGILDTRTGNIYDATTGALLVNPKTGFGTTSVKTDYQMFLQDYEKYGLLPAGYSYLKTKTREIIPVGQRYHGESIFDPLAGVASAFVDIGYSGLLLITNPLEFGRGAVGMIKQGLTEGFPEAGQMIKEKPGYALGYAAGTAVGGEALGATGELAKGKVAGIIERSPTALKVIEDIKMADAFKTISGYAKNIQNTPLFKNIAFEESVIPGKIIPESFKVLKGEKGYAEFMTFKNTLTATDTQRLLAAQAAQSQIADVFNRLQKAGIDTSVQRQLSMDIFANEKAMMQANIAMDANIQRTIMGSTALATEPGFVATRTKLYGQRIPIEEGGGFVGDIELALRGIKADAKKLQLTTEETPTTLKAKTQLGRAKNIYERTIKTKDILQQEREFLEKGLNKNLDLTKLQMDYGLSEIQKGLFEQSGELGLVVKGSAGTKLKKIQMGTAKPEDISFAGKDIDVAARSVSQQMKVNQKIIDYIQKQFPGELESFKQMRIKYAGVTKAELGELSKYTGKGKPGKPPVSTYTEIPTGKVYQVGEAVKFDIKELLDKGDKAIQEQQITFKPLTKGGKIDISLSRAVIKSMEEPVYDIAVEKNFALNLRKALTPGKEIEFFTTEGKSFKTVKTLFQEYENFDRVQNALTYEQIEKGAKHILESIKEGRYDIEKSFKVKAKGAEAYSAEKALKFAKEPITLEKEGERFVVSKVPKEIPEGTELKNVQKTKIFEVYNKETFPELLAGKTEYAEFGGKKVAVQSLVGGRSSKAAAAFVRDIYYGEFGKDIKDAITGRVLDIKRAQEGISKVKDIKTQQSIQAELNKAIKTFYESEARLPISSELDLAARYIKNKLSFEKAEKAEVYKPLTEKQFYEAQKVKIGLEGSQYSKEQLKSVVGNAIESNTPISAYSKIADKAFKKIEKGFGTKETLTKSEAQRLTNNVLKSIQEDISGARKESATALGEKLKAGYPKTAEAKYPYAGYLSADYGYDIYNEIQNYAKYVEQTLSYPTYQPYTKAKEYAKTYPKPKPETYGYPGYPGYPQPKEYAKTYPKYPPFQPPYYPPITPPSILPKSTKALPPLREEKKKEKIRKVLGQGYDVYVKAVKVGKFAKINHSPLTKERAKDVGTYYLDNSLARTYKIQKSGQAQEDYEFMFIPAGYHSQRAYTLRPYRIKKRMPYAFGEQEIKKQQFLLDTRAEREQIQQFKKIAQQMKSVST